MRDLISEELKHVYGAGGGMGKGGSSDVFKKGGSGSGGGRKGGSSGVGGRKGGRLIDNS